YYGPVLQEWRDNSCFDDFQKKLGYRLLLKTSKLDKEAIANGSFELNTTMTNVGFAPVYNTKNAFLVFKSVPDGTVYQKALTFDVRRIAPDSDYNIKEPVNLSGIPAGDYELSIKIGDGSVSLADRPVFSIRLANTDTWEAATGSNKLLHTLTITN